MKRHYIWIHVSPPINHQTINSELIFPINIDSWYVLIQVNNSKVHFILHTLASKFLCQFSSFEALLRSEEHTSELQSRGQLVCRLLLEKKKNVEIKRSQYST